MCKRLESVALASSAVNACFRERGLEVCCVLPMLIILITIMTIAPTSNELPFVRVSCLHHLQTVQNQLGIDSQAAKLYTNEQTTTAKPNLANGSPVTYLTCINYSAESRDVTANSSGLLTSSDHPVAWSLHGTCLISLPKRTLLNFSVKGCGDPAIVCKCERTIVMVRLQSERSSCLTHHGPRSTWITARQPRVLIGVRQTIRHVEEFSCSFADHLKRRAFFCVFKKKRSLNNMFSDLGLQSSRVPSSETKRIHLSQESFAVII